MHHPSDASDRQQTFDASPGAAGAARAWLRSTLHALGAGATATDDLSLALSELVSNLVQHGSQGPITVAVAEPPGWWELRITGTSVPSMPVASWTVADADRAAGRGLGIVRSLMDEVDVDDRTVRCRLRRRDAGGI